MRWVITQHDTIIYGPTTWHAAAYSRELAKNGISVSLPAAEPQREITLGALTIRPVAETAVAYAAATHKADGETITVTNGTVTATPIITAKTADELHPLTDPRETAKHQAYTHYLQICLALGFTTKAGFSEVFAAIDELKKKDRIGALETAVQLLALQSAWIYHGGTWDECPETL